MTRLASRQVYQRARWNAWKALGAMDRHEAKTELRDLLDSANFSDQTFRRSSPGATNTGVEYSVARAATGMSRSSSSSSGSGFVVGHDASGSQHRRRLKKALSLPAPTLHLSQPK